MQFLEYNNKREPDEYQPKVNTIEDLENIILRIKKTKQQIYNMVFPQK